MSAICGIYSPRDTASAAVPVVERLTARLRPRAPHLSRKDSFCHLIDENYGAVLAVSHEGCREDDRALVVVDGDMPGATHKVVTADVAAFVGPTRTTEGHPTPFLFPTTGSWACAAFDRDNATLWLARDPFAKRPLYYYHDPARALVVFASEPRAILEHPQVSGGMSREGLMAFLRFGYLPAPASAFDGIRKVFPGVALSFDASGRKREHRFWSMPPIHPIDAELEDTLPAVRQHVLQSVEQAWSGDDLPGLFLSGGLDSTIVLAALRELGVRNVRTFTFGYDRYGQTYTTDLEVARRVARAFGTQHEEVWIDETHSPGPGVIRWLEHLDEPFLTPNVYAKALLLRKAYRRGVRRCLTGTGAAYSFERRPDEFLRKLRKRAGKKTSMENWTVFRRANLFTAEEVEELTGWPSEEVHHVCLRLMEGYAKDVRARPWGEFGDFMFDTSIRLQTGEKAAAVMERVGAVLGVDMEHPLYDTQLHTFANTLPAPWKAGKQVLRAAFGKDLPQEVLDRENTGFRSPYWVGANAIHKVKRRYLTQEAFERHGVVRWPHAQRILAAGQAGQRNLASKQAWGLAVLQAWLENNQTSFART